MPKERKKKTKAQKPETRSVPGRAEDAIVVINDKIREVQDAYNLLMGQKTQLLRGLVIGLGLSLNEWRWSDQEMALVKRPPDGEAS